MKSETQEQLFGRYPIFDRPHAKFKGGFNCGEGWGWLLEYTAQRLAELRFKDLRIVGVGEKDGELVIEVEHNDARESDLISAIVASIERWSGKVCKTCGKEGPGFDHCERVTV